jgi:hypothetical protein
MHRCPHRPNTTPSFDLVDITRSPLLYSPSPFKANARTTLLDKYPGDLPTHLYYFRMPDRLFLGLGRIEEVTPQPPLLCSPLGFAPKADGGVRKIHHLSFPMGSLVNNGINEESSRLKYMLLAGSGCNLLGRDIADAFRNIPIAPHRRRVPVFKAQSLISHDAKVYCMCDNQLTLSAFFCMPAFA